LKITGSCTVTAPEWLYDLGCPGHYMRRIKSVGLSIPSVVGPYTSLNCTVSLQRSTLRVLPLLKNGIYARDPAQDDDRFIDYFGAAEGIVTSSGTNDSGMFETNLRDERFLPFEGAGAVSTWTLSLPTELRPFDYMTIYDVILHIRYTARQAGYPLGSHATKELKQMLAAAGQSQQALMFDLRHDFPTEWSAFVNGTSDFTAMLRKDHFPYMVQSAKTLNIDTLTLYSESGGRPNPVTPNVGLDALSTGLSGTSGAATLTLLRSDLAALTGDPSREVFLVLQFSCSFSA
jgi:hypothetical protein